MKTITKSQTRTVILIATVLLSWAVMALGRSDGDSGLVVGEPARQSYVARISASVVDDVATEAARDAAAAAVRDETRTDLDAERTAAANISNFLDTIRESVFARTAVEIPSIGDPVAEDDTNSAIQPEDLVPLEIRVNLRIPGEFVGQDPTPGGVPNDRLVPMAGIRVVAHTERFVSRVSTESGGVVVVNVPSESIEVTFDAARQLPEGTIPSTVSRRVNCAGRDGCAVELELITDFNPIEETATQLSSELLLDNLQALGTLLALARTDAITNLTGDPQELLVDRVEEVVLNELNVTLRNGLSAGDLATEQTSFRQRPPRVPGIPEVYAESARAAAGEVLATFLVYNESVDVERTDALRDIARAEVEPITRLIRAGETIVPEFQVLTTFHIAAIEESGALDLRLIPETAMLGVVAVLVAVIAYYLARFREVYWNQVKMLGLFGVLVVLAAISVRVTIENAGNYSPFILPAVGIGTLAAVLFDNRMGTLMAVTLATLTAVGSPYDSGIVVYALLATIAPVGFVSRASTRHRLRDSAVVSAAAAGGIAAVVAWYFRAPGATPGWPVVADAVLWAFGVSLVVGLLAQPVLAFFEAAFDITTTMRLFELTDRNHAALQLLQEQAFGTFNHSLMVGTLASSASRAIGANSLLARAAAYYHDLGKTQNPLFFIENQFGVPNPHDLLTPEESAEVIRRHVTDGLALARRYRIPSEVAEGIQSHHGDGIMHYFYDKAQRLAGGDVDPMPFRHVGHKPQAKEMAILMMADAVESACRATFIEEEPKPENIAKVVNRVIDEKLGDGQLSECDLTQGELTKVRRAFIEALTGHYHQRIPYPNFPGS